MRLKEFNTKLREPNSLIRIYQEPNVRLVTISHYAANKLYEYYGVKVDEVIYHGVLEMFRRGSGKFPRREVVKLLSVVHLDYVDNPLLIPEAIRYLPASLRKRILVIVRGDGSLKEAFVKMLGELQTHFKIIPRVDFYSMPYIYAMGDIYVHTSHMEGFGFPTCEAMACGLPVIAPRKSVAEEIAGGCALFFEPSDPQDLADKIEVLLVDTQLYDETSERCF